MSNRKSDLKLIDGGFYFLAVICIGSGSAVLWLHGLSGVLSALKTAAGDSLFIFPLVGLGVTIGALLTTLVPKEVVARHLGRQAGFKAIILSTVIGSIMPGGPFVAFPVVVALGGAGASIGSLIAFLTAWSAVGVHRLLVWEIPFMGTEFGMLRFICSIPIPIIAGIVANRLSANVRALRMDWEKLP